MTGPETAPELPTVPPAEIVVQAKRGCRHCYGRGYAGWGEDRKPIPCRCILRRKPQGAKLIRIVAARP